MKSFPMGVIVLAAASVLTSGCIAAEGQRQTVRKMAAPAASTSMPPAEFPVRDEASRERDKRGNTPPGMDRSGGGPTSGAILDPRGAVTKSPVLREYQEARP